MNCSLSTNTIHLQHSNVHGREGMDYTVSSEYTYSALLKPFSISL